MSESLHTLQGLVRSLESTGDRNAIRAFTRRDVIPWSYGELGLRSQQLAAGLAAAGIKKGEPVGLLAPNSAEWLVACLAILNAGAIVTPFDSQMPAAELAHAVQDSGIRYVFTAGEAARRLETLSLAAPPEAIRLDGADGDPYSWTAWCREAPDPQSLPDVTPDDFATLFYTSGTTGPPKGVPLTHGNIASNVNALLGVEIGAPDDRILVPLPFHHVYPFTIGIVVALALGASTVLPHSVLGPQIVRALREGDATVILGVPRLYEALNAAIQGRIAERGRTAERFFEALLSVSGAARRRFGWRLGPTLFRGLHRRMGPSVRLVVSGGAALKPAVAERLHALGWEIGTGYGLTETSPILTYNPPERVRLRSAGLALPGVTLRIGPVDENGLGEVQATGPNVFSGYWNLPEKTAKAFTDDGFYRTGDLGWFDDDGYLYLEGRASEMIVLAGGENIDPERVEGVLASVSGISDAGVLEHEGRLVALLYPDPDAMRDVGSDSDVDQRMQAALNEANGQLPSHHQVGDYRISPHPLPRTRLGKLRRHKLRERFAGLEGTDWREALRPGPMPEEEMAGEDQQLLQIPLARRVWGYLGDRFDDVRLTPDSSLRLDLGVDSLGWVNLTLDLHEQCGVLLAEDAIGRVETVRDLLREAAESEESATGTASLEAQLQHPDPLLNERQRAFLVPVSGWRRACARATWGPIRAIFRNWFRVETQWEGGDFPADPVVLVPNHQSYLDPVALAAALPVQRMERLYWGAWTEIMFRTRLRRGFSRMANVLPVDPRSGPRTALALAAATLARGHNLTWFPEGGLSPDGHLQQFQPGIGLILRAQGVRAVPVYIDGTRSALPPGSRWPRRAPIRVTIGAAVSVKELEAQGAGERPEERIADALHQRVAALAGPSAEE